MSIVGFGEGCVKRVVGKFDIITINLDCIRLFACFIVWLCVCMTLYVWGVCWLGCSCLWVCFHLLLSIIYFLVHSECVYSNVCVYIFIFLVWFVYSVTIYYCAYIQLVSHTI